MPTKKNRFLLLYGSQTGQAEAITEEIAEAAPGRGFVCERHSLAQTEKKFVLENESCVVIVTSTTGDGEPPDTALKFVRRLKKKSLPDNHLQTVNYALLGLGDSNYTNFCNCGKTLDRRMEELGAKRFYNSGWGDDAVGLEVAVEPWIEGLWPALHKFLNVTCSKTENMCPDLHVSSPEHSDLVSCEGQEKTSKPSSNGMIENKDFDSNLPSNGIMGNEDQDSNLSTNGITGNGDHSLHTSNVNENCCHSSENGKPDTNTNARTENCEQNGCVSNLRNETFQQNGIESPSLKHTVSNESVKSEKRSETNRESPVYQMDRKAIDSTLRTSIPPLSEAALSVPILPQPFLTIDFKSEESVDLSVLEYQNGSHLPSAATPITMATIESAQVMTSSDSVKKTLCLRLKFEEDNMIKYEPGDSISICCQNEEKEVDMLLNRLGVAEMADIACELSLVSDTKKKNAAVPPHLPPRATLRHLFTTCVDIREPPKKAVLRALVECTDNDSEKRRLQELCSKQGAADYTKHIREADISILDLLNVFPSCGPSAARLLELLPRLQPRPYSVCSSHFLNPNILEIVLNVVEISQENGRSFRRHGVCTGMIDRLTKDIQTVYKAFSTPGEMIDKLRISDGNDIKLPIFGRTNQNFRPPDDLSVPIILIGPGTGVAPFIGFCRHRDGQRTSTKDQTQYGATWLFYGCRHRDRDYLYREEMQQFRESGIITELCVCFSRDEQTADAPRYVQDNILRSGKELVDLLDNTEAHVYVCGDAKNMAKDVNQAFMTLLQEHKGISEDESRSYLMKLRLKRRYLEDVWT